MSSAPSPAVVSSLDDSLTLPFTTVELLRAVNSIDVEGVIRQLNVAAEYNRNLRSLVTSALPEATWRTRDELDALLADIQRLSVTRSRLLALAMELESGLIVHRRAWRATEVNQLREQAIVELRSHTAPGKVPPILPGPEPEHWIEWACALKEPEDAASLQALRDGFVVLDDFVANLEPEMWVPKTETRAPLSNGARVATTVQEVQEQARSRLLALATELERGNIQHHRATRVSQLNRLRQKAITELRARAESDSVSLPSALPGPAVRNWLEWACALREPEDAEALTSLRLGFPDLDDFVVNLDLEMWTAGSSPLEEMQVEEEKTADKLTQEPSRVNAAKVDYTRLSSSSTSIELREVEPREEVEGSQLSDGADEPPQPAPESINITAGQVAALPSEERSQALTSPETSPTPEISFHITTGVGEARTRKWWMPIAIVALVALGAYGAMEWRWYSNPTVSAQAAEDKNFDVTRPAANQGSEQSAVSSDAGTHSPTQNAIGREAALQDPGVSPKAAPITASAIHTPMLGDTRLRSSGTSVSNDFASISRNSSYPESATQPSSASFAGAQGPVPNGATSIPNDSPAGQPMHAAEKSSIAPGGVQGLVIRRVAPLYPASARQAHIEGTVVLRALIGKDGSVSNVRVSSGHPMLIQAAVDAAKQWHFNPYYVDGEAVEADTQINVNFTLQNN